MTISTWKTGPLLPEYRYNTYSIGYRTGTIHTRNQTVLRIQIHHLRIQDIGYIADPHAIITNICKNSQGEKKTFFLEQSTYIQGASGIVARFVTQI
jgi:hypothetical protein